MNEPPENAFAGLMSALAIVVVLVALTIVAIVVAIGTDSNLAGVLAWVAMMIMAGVAILRVPAGPD